jgi:hypothetical protein
VTTREERAYRTRARNTVKAHMLNLRPNRSAVIGAINWIIICDAKFMACHSETWVELRAGEPVSGSVTVANCSMKPSLAMILPITE